MWSIGSLAIASYYRAKLEWEEWQTRRLFYHHASFAHFDRALLDAYRLINPYQISKDFFIEQGEADPHQYGETPIRTYAKIAELAEISPEDHVIELGCGRGRGLIFFATYCGSTAHGIEWNPRFVQKIDRLQVPKVTLACADMLTADLTPATFVYLYGTCLSEQNLQKLLFSLEKMRQNTKIVTVSEPLKDKDLFVCTKTFPIRFPWGVTEGYLHLKT